MFGDDEKKLDVNAWYGENVKGKPHPVGKKHADPWDLFDIYGKVWEWVADWYGPYPAAAQTDPLGLAKGTARVLRGGAFDLLPRFQRSAFRNRIGPSRRVGFIGFRCARGPSG